MLPTRSAWYTVLKYDTPNRNDDATWCLTAHQSE